MVPSKLRLKSFLVTVVGPGSRATRRYQLPTRLRLIITYLNTVRRRGREQDWKGSGRKRAPLRCDTTDVGVSKPFRLSAQRAGSAWHEQQSTLSSTTRAFGLVPIRDDLGRAF